MDGTRIARVVRLGAAFALGIPTASALADDGPWGTVAPPAVPDPPAPPAVEAHVESPRAASLELILTPDVLPADGATAATVIVHARDASGRIVPADVKILATSGEVRNPMAMGVGTLAALLVPPQGGTAASITVSAFDVITGVTTSKSVSLTGTGAPVAAPVAGSAATTRAPAASDTPVSSATVAAPVHREPAPPPARRGRIQVLYPIARYAYDSMPCATLEGTTCVAPAEEDLQAPTTGYQVVSLTTVTPLPQSIGLDAEYYPTRYIGFGGGFSVFGYRTTTPVTTDDGEAGTFGDDLVNVHVDARGRIPLVESRGWLDLLPRIGFHTQDAVIFRYENPPGVDPVGERSVRFDTVWLYGMRLGLGLRYLDPRGRVEPHVSYDMTASFNVGAVTNHRIEVGLGVRPLKWLLFDASYGFEARDLLFEFDTTPDDGDPEDGGQTGSIAERMHAVRLGAGVAF